MMKRFIIRMFFVSSSAIAVAALFATAGCKQEAETASRQTTSQEAASSKEEVTPYYQGLIEEYRTVLAEDPHNLAATIALGNAFYDAGRWQGAIQYYERALRIDPHSVDAMTDMGTCYRNLGVLDKAIETYLRVIAIEPNHLNALFNLGIIYGEDKKDYRKAVKYWEHLLHLSPKHPQADNIRVSIHAYKQMLRKKAP